MAMPTLYEDGAAVSGTGSITIPWGIHAANFLAVVIIQTANESIVNPSAGWTLIGTAGVGTPGAAGATRVTALWKRAASGSEVAFTADDPGDHWVAKMYTFQNVTTTGNPINTFTSSTVATPQTAASIVCGTSTNPNCLIHAISAGALDTEDFVGSSGSSNPSLDGSGFGGWAQTTNGVGGGFYGALGEKAVAGSLGTYDMAAWASPTAQANISYSISDTPTSSLNDYEIVGETGVFSLAGTATDLLVGRSLPIDSGAFSLSGTTVDLLHGRIISSENGSFVLSGTDADLTYNPVFTHEISSSVTGLGILTATPVINFGAEVALLGIGVSASSASITLGISNTLLGGSAVSATGSVIYSGASTFVGSGEFVGTASVILSVASSLIGEGVFQDVSGALQVAANLQAEGFIFADVLIKRFWPYSFAIPAGDFPFGFYEYLTVPVPETALTRPGVSLSPIQVLAHTAPFAIVEEFLTSRRIPAHRRDYGNFKVYRIPISHMYSIPFDGNGHFIQTSSTMFRWSVSEPTITSALLRDWTPL